MEVFAKHFPEEVALFSLTKLKLAAATHPLRFFSANA